MKRTRSLHFYDYPKRRKIRRPRILDILALCVQSFSPMWPTWKLERLQVRALGTLWYDVTYQIERRNTRYFRVIRFPRKEPGTSTTLSIHLIINHHASSIWTRTHVPMYFTIKHCWYWRTNPITQMYEFNWDDFATNTCCTQTQKDNFFVHLFRFCSRKSFHHQA